jgi:DNA polymerase-1
VLPIDPERRYAALNYMIQSTSRDLLVVALRRILANINDIRDNVVMLVHDEILFEFPEEEAEVLAQLVKDEMATVLYGVPIAADAEVLGERWSS